ncbi:MAG: IS1 family transposase [Chloroflexota bacterium]|nr:MAG: IS1 family transposase [Chloroflexota bacterium]
MDPHSQFCHNPACSARGVIGQGNIRIFSRRERRYQCTTCDQTFTVTKDTPFYRLHKTAELMVLVLTLLCHGCPVQAIVAAFGLDERTVAAWQTRSGHHCQRVHEQVVQQEQVDVQHVQADELWVKMVGQRVWMAMALAVPSRLWLGGVISAKRDLVLITALVQMVRACACSLAILVCGRLGQLCNGLPAGVPNPTRTGRRGSPRLVLEKGLPLGQVIKRHAKRRVMSVTRRVVRGTAESIRAVLIATGGGNDINTAYIERLNATFRASMVALVRRGRALLHKEAGLTAGMYLVGCAYNFVWYHESLRAVAPAGASHKWQERIPAMAAGLTDHRWTMFELFSYQVPLPPWVAPKRRGRQATVNLSLATFKPLVRRNELLCSILVILHGSTSHRSHDRHSVSLLNSHSLLEYPRLNGVLGYGGELDV